MSPIIDSEDNRICYVCGRPMVAWVSVNMTSVPNAEICCDCTYKLAEVVAKKENERVNNIRDGECN